MEAIISRIDQQLEKIDQQLEQYETLQAIHEKTQIRISLLTAIMVLSGSMLCFILCGPSFLVNIIGSAYPIYYTFKLLISHSKEEYSQIIVYWMLFGLFYCFECLFIDVSQYIPLFYPFKVSFLLACLSKDINLSKVIYDNILVKYFDMPDISQQKRLEKVEMIQNREMNDSPQPEEEE